MAVTYTVTEHLDAPQREGRNYVNPVRLTLTGTYVTGGFTLSANDFRMGHIKHVDVNNAWNGTEQMVAVWDKANDKIKLGWSGGAISSELDEITNGDTVTNFVVDMVVRGT